MRREKRSLPGTSSFLATAGFAALTAFALGCWGFTEVGGSSPSATDAMYQSLQLFTLEGSLPERGTPWQLDVARFLAPAVVASTGIVALAALLRDQASRSRVRRLSGHTVVIGVGDNGAKIAHALAVQGKRVVALDVDPTRVGTLGARYGGVTAMQGDGTSRALLAALAVGKARNIVITTGDDSRNLQVLSAIHAETAGGRTGPKIHVNIESVPLWKELQRQALGPGQDSRDPEYFNLQDRTARRLVTRALGDLCQRPEVTAMVAGTSPLGTSVVSHLVRRLRLSGRTCRILLGPLDESAQRARLEEEEPWVADEAEIRTLSSGPIADVVFVCTDDDAAAMATAASLTREVPDTPVLVPVHQEESDRVIEARLGPRVKLVPAKLEALTRELLEASALEIIAAARHEDYVRQETARRGDATAEIPDPSLSEWEELPESLRESNRRFAEQADQLLAAMGASLRPLRTGLPQDLPIPREKLDELAENEHNRWRRDLEAAGWAYHPGPKDPEALKHPLLVGWENLDEAAREKDRDAVRALPKMLAMVGYEIVFPDRPK